MDKMDWKRIIEEQKQSGKSMSSFCKELGILPNKFIYHRDKLGLKKEKQENRFVRVGTAEKAEVIFPGGVVLRVPEGMLKEVVQSLSNNVLE